MNEDHVFEEQFKSKYPKLFKNLRYLEVSTGWYDLIHKVSSRIEQVNQGYSGDDGIFASQIKTKFGGLRYYISSENVSRSDVELVNAFIAEAESISYSICEGCGGDVDQKIASRYASLCSKCSIKVK